MNKKKIFLLGGNDLEMLEIKRIFNKYNIQYEDEKLSWENAKLSAYQQKLEKYKNDENIIIYGIELEADIKFPKNYIEIDHHGKNDDKPSSIEQIAKILNIELSRDQKLIAANDSRYIGGMKNLCATKDEIDNIRKKDREAQGINADDEELAKESFEIASSNNSNSIFSKTPKFSAVSDLVYKKFDNYVIYDDTKMVFYGYKKENILEFLKSQNIDESNYYYGGGEFGFVGIKENMLNEKQINDVIEEFKKLNLYSYHTFMLPFTFKGDFLPKNCDWKYKAFNLTHQRDFNEYVYFYKHIQDAIYNSKEPDEEKWISKYYEYKKQKGTYTIDCKKGNFELELDGLSLRIFNTNIGILSFNLKNNKYSDVDSVLAINDFGRRIYPQFLGTKFTKNPKDAFLANKISLKFANEEPIPEDFTKFDTLNLKKLDEIPFMPKFITELINQNFNEPDKIRPIIDDRMFVISQYMNDALVSKLKSYKECSNQYEYENNDFWYKYIFIDGDGKTCQSKHMTKKLISESTYDRWIEWGTLFGISRYSFVALTGNWFGNNRLLPHMQTMYFQMFTLLLAYRATIIKFSDDIQNATKTSEDLEKLSKETKDIYKKYLDFLNKLYFKEVTAQDQGIELYNQAMKVMDIEKYMNDLDYEVNQLHTYVDMREEKSRNDKLGFISKMGAVLLPPSLLAGLFGMNVLTVDETEYNQLLAFVFIILSGIIGILMTLNLKSIFSTKMNFSSILKFIIPVFFVLLVLNSFNLSNKFSFDFLKDSLSFDKKLETKKNPPEPQEVEITNSSIEVNLSDKKGEK